jgi:hypothetical protein
MGEFLLAESAGVKVLRYRKRGAIDYKEALAAHRPDLDPDALEPFRKDASACVHVTALKDGQGTVPFAAARIETAAREGEAHRGFFF